MADLLDEMRTVMLWHVAIGILLAVIYGWHALAGTICVGLAWCVILLIVPARKVPEWTPPK